MPHVGAVQVFTDGAPLLLNVAMNVPKSELERHVVMLRILGAHDGASPAVEEAMEFGQTGMNRKALRWPASRNEFEHDALNTALGKEACRRA